MSLLECFHSSSDCVCLQVRLSRRKGEYTICACMRKTKREHKGDSPWSWSESVPMSTRSPVYFAVKSMHASPQMNLKTKTKKLLKCPPAWQSLGRKYKKGDERGWAANYKNWPGKQLPSAENHTVSLSLSHAHTPTHTVNLMQQSDPPITHWMPADPTFPHLSSILPER